MKLEELVKTSLDELRMQMLGAQVLFGFQFQGVFQDAFRDAGAGARRVDAVALALIVLTLALLIAAPAQHRLVDRGNPTMRILLVAQRFATVALAPFALALGCDMYVVTDRFWGTGVAAAFAIGTTLCALLLWYALGSAVRVTLPSGEHTMSNTLEPGTSLHGKIEQMLTESRVILPGAQAMLGFQFVATMTSAFAALARADRIAHFVALACVALAVMLLITPAAVHRMAFRGQDVERFYGIGSRLVTIALLPLTLGIAIDVYVAGVRMLDSHSVALGSAVGMLAFLLVLWYGVPFWLRRRLLDA